MNGFTESLNISVSVGIILFELRNQLKNSEFNFLLKPEEETAQKIKWCTNIINDSEKVEQEIRKRILEKMK